MVGGVGFFESARVFKCVWKVREDGQSSRVYVGIFKGLCRVGLCKVRGGGRNGFECARKVQGNVGWKVLGKFEGVGWEGAWKVRGCVGVESSRKVRGKFGV